MRPVDEEQLIEVAAHGDQSALADLYNRYADKIYRYVLYRTGDATTAEDITADVFLRAIEGLNQYRDRGRPFVAWLYRIAHARVVDHWRSVQRRPVFQLDDPSVREHLRNEDELSIDVLERQALGKALQQITHDQRQAIRLKFMQGFANDEIALIMHKSANAVKALQYRGLVALARILAQ